MIAKRHHALRDKSTYKMKLPKVETLIIFVFFGCVALWAANAGVERVHVIDARTPHSVIAELFTDQGVGTLVTVGRLGHGHGQPTRRPPRSFDVRTGTGVTASSS